MPKMHESNTMSPCYTATHNEEHGIIRVIVPTWESEEVRPKPSCVFTLTYSFVPIPSDPFSVRMHIEGTEISPKRYIVDNLIAALQYCTFAAEHVEKNKTHPPSFDEFLRSRGRRHMPTLEKAEEILDELIEGFFRTKE